MISAESKMGRVIAALARERTLVTTPVGFGDLVLAWLRSHGGQPGATSVTEVTGVGTDDAGDTDHGFYPAFSVRITWCDETGATHTRDVEGTDMAHLWNWVTKR